MPKKKVTSTYRREFSPDRTANQPCIRRSFDSNYNYREYRRQAEHGHHRSAFIWDDWEYELEQAEPTPRQMTSQQTNKRRSGCKTKTQCVEQSLSSSSDTDSSDDVSSVRLANGPQERRCRVTVQPPVQPCPNTPSERESCSECNCGADGPIKPKWQGQPARVLSDTISKSLKKVSKRSEQPDLDPLGRPRTCIDESPFVQYGLGDDETEVAVKRTHNVLSHQGVYETAKGAKQRHLSAREIRRRDGRLNRATTPSATRLDQAEFEEKLKNETSRWQSEYNKHYRQFPVCRHRRCV